MYTLQFDNKLYFIVKIFKLIKWENFYRDPLYKEYYLQQLHKAVLNKVWRFPDSYSIFTKCWSQVLHSQCVTLVLQKTSIKMFGV